MSTITKRIKSNVLRRLATAPLSQWPRALVECLDTLSAFGVCDRSVLAGRLRHAPGAGHEPADSARESTLPPERMSPHVRRVCAYMRAHYGEPISLHSLATRVGRNTG